MAANEITVNFDVVASDLEGWQRTVGAVITQESRHFADQLRSRVESQVPVLTGTLARSVTTVDEPDGFGIGLGENIIYAGYIEFGGRHGRPLVPQGRYLYPTILEAAPEWDNVVEEAVATSIDRYPWSRPV